MASMALKSEEGIETGREERNGRRMEGVDV